MALDYNPYGTYKSPKVPTQKRSRCITGDLSDDGKFYTCWNCGFTVDSTKYAIGVGSGVISISYVDTDGVTKYKPSVISGCPMCGSKNYR